MYKRRGLMALLLVLLIIVVDQIIKIYVKTHFYLGEQVEFTSWCRILFVENNGMAFGMEIVSKLLLTFVRIAAVIFLVWYIICISASRVIKTGYLVCLALVLAGALGNIIDCTFYGLLFNDPAAPATASIFPGEGGYAPLFYGKVVDMFYFPLFSWDWPQWMPFVGGERFVFFSPVFNFADAAISVGIIAILLFYSKQVSVSKSVFGRDKAGIGADRGQ